MLEMRRIEMAHAQGELILELVSDEKILASRQDSQDGQHSVSSLLLNPMNTHRCA